MDKLIDQLAEWTTNVMQRLDTLDYEELAALIDQRQGYIDQLKQCTLTEQDIARHRDRVTQLLQNDERIVGRLLALKEEAGGGRQKITSGRIQKNAYETSYSLDGVFFDKRK